METNEGTMVIASRVSEMIRTGQNVKVQVNNEWLSIEAMGVPIFNIGSYFMKVRCMPFDFVVPVNKIFPVRVI